MYTKPADQNNNTSLSGTRDTTSATKGVVEAENVHFIDANQGNEVSVNNILDESYLANTMVKAKLGDFFSRPVLIHSVTWSDGATLSFNIKPWQLYFNNAAIKKKIDNYAWMNGRLTVKAVVNASRFYYGSAIVAYRPLPKYNGGNIFSGTSDATAKTTALSQRPHFYIYPQGNQGGTLHLPFMYHKDYLRIGSNTDFEDMGEIDVLSQTTLLNANGIAGTGCTIRFFAYAEEVNLSGPTTQLALQASDEYEENDGFISAPASAVAEAAGMLSDAPFIGPYARATSMVAGAVGAVAKLFGFTDVPVIDNSIPFKSAPFHSMACPDISVPVEKLTVDSKNELSIDPRLSGAVAEDQMQIKTLVQRNAFIDSFNWAITDAPGGALWNCRVTPDLKQFNFDGTNNIVVSTPLAHFSAMFRKWRGTIRYKFRLIKSIFHAGRIQISWDPDVNNQSNTDIFTTTYTKIVDIADVSEFTFDVPYNQGIGFLNTKYDQVYEFGTGLIPSRDIQVDNGFVNVKVMSELTSADSTSGITILVDVCAGDDFELGDPQELPLITYFELQASDAYKEEDDADLSMMMYEPQLDRNKNLFHVYMGEKVTSIRQLMRRWTLLRSSYVGGSTNTDLLKSFISIHSRRPIYYGYDPNGIHSASNQAGTALVNFNYVNQSYISWCEPCFLGRRGAYHWRVNVDSAAPVSSLTYKRSDATLTTANYVKNVSIASTGTNSDLSAFALNNWGSGTSGLALTNGNTQTCLEVSAPNYASLRFQSTNPAFAVEGSTEDQSEVDSMQLTCNFHPVDQAITGDIDSTQVHFYVQIGTDYSCFQFINVPTFYFLSVPSTTI